MDALNITINEDGTLALEGEFLQQATVTDDVWDQLAANPNVTVDHREWDVQNADGTTTPAESTAAYITTVTVWLNYTVTSHEAGVRVLDLGGYADR